MACARIETMKDLLIGKDPLMIEVHYQNMSSLMHTYMAHIPTVSGIDIALWDLAGKIMGVPVSTLLGGGFRDHMLLYSHGNLLKDTLDPASCRDWRRSSKQQPEASTPSRSISTPYSAFPWESLPTLWTARNCGRSTAPTITYAKPW
jgi:Mandelate racemase / muconate lactonizing enzyme, N-terminal domain